MQIGTISLPAVEPSAVPPASPEATHPYAAAQQLPTCGSQGGIVRLRADWRSLLPLLRQLGQVTSVTTSCHATLHYEGQCPEYQHFDRCGLFSAEAFDLRVCLPFWAAAFAIACRLPGEASLSRSLHFYDQRGGTIHQTFLGRNSVTEAFEEILERFVEQDQSPFPCAVESGTRQCDPSCCRTSALLSDWSRLKNTLEFTSLLREHRVTRQYAFLAGQGLFTRRLGLRTLRSLLQRIAVGRLGIETRVGNGSCEQACRDEIRSVSCPAGVLAIRGHNTAVRITEDSIASAWILKIPTKSGPIESIELNDADGNTIASIRGVRIDTGCQSSEWHRLLEAMPDEQEPARFPERPVC